MLYVVAWPLLAEADEQVLRRLRALYHPTEAELIGPHFTLVFGVSAEREAELGAALSNIRRRPFWFMIERIARSDLYLYAEPSVGASELVELHDALNPKVGPVPFEPHITLGRFGGAAEAERVARLVGRQNLPIRGRVEELALLKRQDQALVTLATHRLSD
jgi:2'-5' RNA ligase